VTQNIIYLEVAKAITYSSLTFLIGLWWGPYLIQLLVWLKFWKKKPRSTSTTGEDLVVTKKFYEDNEQKRLVPRAGGLLITITTIGFAMIFWLYLKIDSESKLAQFLNFVNRKQTFIPLAALFFGSFFGLIDDALSTLDSGGNYKAGGLKLSQRLMLMSVLSLMIGFWFAFKIEITQLTFFNTIIDFKNLPFGLNLPWLIIPITFVVLVGLWGTSVIDGLDGLAVGVFVPIYLVYAILAFVKEYDNIGIFLMVMIGSMVAYLWYNITPAKFILGDSGAIAIVLTLGVVSILINMVYILPIAAIMPVLTAGSNIVQIFSKKVFKRKVLLAAPLHHHLEAIGWSKNQIVMRYWLVSILSSATALVLGLIFR
jgi:phospho-N-acetylmuramoyl-pentapeptide-transferase